MFCRNCGKEIGDAVYCPYCDMYMGAQPENKPAVTPIGAIPTTPAQGEKGKKTFEKSARLSKIFGTVSFGLMAAAFFLAMAGISDIVLYYEYAESPFEMAFFLSFVALGFSITSFVFGLKTKECLGVKYVSTLIFIMSIVMLFVPAFYMVE